MGGDRYGGRFSPGSKPEGADSVPHAPVFRSGRARNVSLRARLMYLFPIPLIFAGLGSIARGSAGEMLGEVGGFALLMLGAFLLNEGLRAEEAYGARAVARPPAIPRKILSALLAGGGVAFVGLMSLGQGLFAAVTFGIAATLAHLVAFGIDPLRRKGMEGVDDFANERVARAIDQAEAVVREIAAVGSRLSDRRLEGRIDRLCDQAREVFRTIEADPRDLSRARTFLSVYLVGLRDATVKFAEIWNRSRDAKARTEYENLLGDLETSFAQHRTHLLQDDRGDLDIEIEVLRERLQQDGLLARG